ncbi:MAG: hypothetical protein ABSB82_15100 [Terriglobia bacterium]
MTSVSTSSPESEAKPWLEEKVYKPKRRRTVELVKSSVDALMKDCKRVSLAALCIRSKEVDPDGRGVSESAILRNEEARTYYKEHRSWKAASRNRQRICQTALAPGRIKIDRDLARVRSRYLKLTKAELAQRLLAVEQAHAALQERWFQVNEQMLSWRMRAEEFEPQVRRGEG